MAKDKRRNSEKRKEKSRDAARCRRGKESEVFVDLADCLPLSESVTQQLDKASIMRLSISVLKIGAVLAEVPVQCGQDKVREAVVVAEEQMKECRVDQLYQRALEGFTFILSQEGNLVYLSESVAKYLGLTQIEMMGQSIYEFTHPCDHEEIGDLLAIKNGTGLKEEHNMPESKSSFLRLKCTLTSKGRNVNLKSASYKVMKCSGRLIPGSTDESKDKMSETALSDFPFLVGVAEPIPHPSNIEVPLDCNTFLSKHSMDMKFLVCDERIQELAGYTCDEMIGKSFFDFTHALDSNAMGKIFKDLFSKGQVVTNSYRFLSATGGYIWVVTQATVINNSRSPKPQFVVCVHYVLSGIEEQGTILSHVQKPTEPLSSIFPPKLEMCTENIFAPKTKDMEKAYFVPPELKGKITYLNDEPKDLSYLAPNAGEESIPFVSSSMTDCLLSPASSVEGYMLKQERSTPGPDMSNQKMHSPMSVLSSAASSRGGSPKTFEDPFVPVDVDSMGQYFQSLDSNDNIGGVLDSIDFDGRAPYIPMDGDEDLEIFAPSSNALFTFSNDVNPGLFGKTEKVFASKDSLFEEQEPQVKFLSVRDMIDGSTAKASIEQPPDTMYQQMKRPLDMNSLEKGPPMKKVSRLEAEVPAQPSKPKGPVSSGNTESVLLNLLLSGEDRNHGYKVTTLPGVQLKSKVDMPVPQSPKIPLLTRRDCEANAPILFSQLLQGTELLRALDTDAVKSIQKNQVGSGMATFL